MYKLEADNIIKYNPTHNTVLPSCEGVTTINTCLSESKAAINNMIKELPVIFQRSNRSYVKTDSFERIMKVMIDSASKELSLINNEFMECK